jgi:hypothetical protein
MTEQKDGVGFHFHRWSKWQQYFQEGVSYGFAFRPHEGKPFTERRQKRYCLICNKEQDEEVKAS